VRRTLKKSEILRGRKNFDFVFKHGKKIDGKILRCISLKSRLAARCGAGSVIFGIAVSRAVRRAVDRNRIKRLVRESYRINKEIILPGAIEPGQILTVLFIYPPKSSRMPSVPSYRDIEEDVKTILKSVTLTENNSLA